MEKQRQKALDVLTKPLKYFFLKKIYMLKFIKKTHTIKLRNFS